MRLIAAIMTLVALGAAALAGQRLYVTLAAPPSAPEILLATALPPSTPLSDATPESPRRWATLFGEVQPPQPEPEPQPPTPEPQPPEPEPEPQPPEPEPEPEPPKPTVESLGYRLKGVVRVGDKVWAMASHPTGEQLMRVGDELAKDVRIERIDEDGLWVDNGEKELVLLGFSDQ